MTRTDDSTDTFAPTSRARIHDDVRRSTDACSSVRLATCLLAAALLAGGLVACSGQQQPSSQQAPSASQGASQAQDEASSASASHASSAASAASAAQDDIPTIADKAFVLVKMRQRTGTGANAAMIETENDTLDAHGNILTCVLGESTSEDEGTHADAEQHTGSYTMAYDENGFPSSVAGGELVGYGEGAVQVSANDDGTVFTILYPSGAQDVVTLFDDRLHVKSIVFADTGESSGMGVTNTTTYDHDGYATENVIDVSDGSSVKRTFTWKFTKDGEPVSCSVKADVKHGNAKKDAAAHDIAESYFDSMPKNMTESATYSVKTDGNSNIAEFGDGEDLPLDQYEYAEVTNPSIYATLMNEIKPTP